jgi:hypothetical protein
MTMSPMPSAEPLLQEVALVRAVGKRVHDEGIGLRRQVLDGAVDARGQVETLVGHGDAEVEVDRDPVVRVEHRRLVLQVHEQVGVDDVALEPGVEVAVVPVRVLVGEEEVQVAVAQALALEAVVVRLRVVDPEAQLPLARGDGALGEDRAEGVRAAD